MTLRAVTDADFAAAVAGPGPVLVHFVASWCQPCAAAGLAVAGLAQELRPRRGFPGAVVVTADIDAAPHGANAANVRGVPCLALYRAGVPVASLMGFYQRDKLRAWFDAALKG